MASSNREPKRAFEFTAAGTTAISNCLEAIKKLKEDSKDKTQDNQVLAQFESAEYIFKCFLELAQTYEPKNPKWSFFYGPTLGFGKWVLDYATTFISNDKINDLFVPLNQGDGSWTVAIKNHYSKELADTLCRFFKYFYQNWNTYTLGLPASDDTSSFKGDYSVFGETLVSKLDLNKRLPPMNTHPRQIFQDAAIQIRGNIDFYDYYAEALPKLEADTIILKNRRDLPAIHKLPAKKLPLERNQEKGKYDYKILSHVYSSREQGLAQIEKDARPGNQMTLFRSKGETFALCSLQYYELDRLIEFIEKASEVDISPKLKEKIPILKAKISKKFANNALQESIFTIEEYKYLDAFLNEKSILELEEEENQKIRTKAESEFKQAFFRDTTDVWIQVLIKKGYVSSKFAPSELGQKILDAKEKMLPNPTLKYDLVRAFKELNCLTIEDLTLSSLKDRLQPNRFPCYAVIQPLSVVKEEKKIYCFDSDLLTFSIPQKGETKRIKGQDIFEEDNIDLITGSAGSRMSHPSVPFPKPNGFISFQADSADTINYRSFVSDNSFDYTTRH